MQRLTEMQFEDIPLVSSEGFEALFADGWVDIQYWGDGSYTLGTIVLDGIHCNIDPPFGGTLVRKRLKCDAYLQSMIRVKLSTDPRWQQHIKDHIQSQMTQERVS